MENFRALKTYGNNNNDYVYCIDMPFQKIHYLLPKKFRGVAPGSAHAKPSAQPPIDTSGNVLKHVYGRGGDNFF